MDFTLFGDKLWGSLGMSIGSSSKYSRVVVAANVKQAAKMRASHTHCIVEATAWASLISSNATQEKQILTIEKQIAEIEQRVDIEK